MTTIVPSEVDFDRLQAVFLRGHLRLLAAGMQNSRMSRKEILAKAGSITGKKYKNSVAQCEKALNDLGELLK
jgi:hypothetical protein